jgi:hypothetical protein
MGAGIGLSVVPASILFSNDARAAGAAYQVDVADVTAAGACKIESWLSWAKNSDFVGAVSPACGMDLGKPSELSAQFNRARFDHEWFSTLTPKIKTNLIPTAIGKWGVSISATAAYDMITAENIALAATIPATLRLNENMRINVNVGWQWDRILNRHFATYGLGFDWRTSNNVWTWTAEVFGLFGTVEEELLGLVRPRFQTGLRWRPIDRFSIDVIYGRNLYGEESNWVTVATIIRFPAPGK